MNLSGFRAAIFDMDGLLIDSEPLWRRAEVQAFRAVGLDLTEDDCRVTTGMRIDDVVGHWFERRPWPGKPVSAVAADVLERVCELIRRQGSALPGVAEALATVRGAGLRVALATSSPQSVIDAVLRRLGLQDAFEIVASAADEERGKPDPAVYLSTARRLGVEPARCIAFEDSVAGVASARAAGMKVVAVPAPESFDLPAFDLADLKLPSLAELSAELRRARPVKG